MSNDISDCQQNSHRPPHVNSLITSGFSLPSPNHSFLQEASFKTIFMLVLKLGHFEPQDILALHKFHQILSQDFRESCIKNKNCPVGYFFMVKTLSRELLIQSTR
jgi:hypothetical protein